MHMSHKKKFTLGVYGDGQLARLLALSALPQQISLLIYTLKASDSPCRDLCALYEGKSWTDQKSFSEFADQCETIVLENEFAPAEYLLKAEKDGQRIFPAAESFEKVSNKLKQVQLAQSLGMNIPKFSVIEHSSQLDQLQLPVMLKSLSGGYDGYGNFTFKTQDQFHKAKEFISTRGPALAQEFLNFDQEVAVIIAGDGENYFSFPVVETIQEKNICHFVLTPPRLSESVQYKIKEQASKLIKAIGGVGVYGVEFFITGEEVVFNEIAPRTHNSGHYSIEACDYSQFDALIKLILGQKLTAPQMTSPAVGMLNLLGTQNGKAHFEGDPEFTNNPQGFLHLYGKEDSRIGRKMGHYTLLGDNQEMILNKLEYLKNRYSL